MCSFSITARARSIRRLYLIGKRPSQGSQRQRAVFMPAKWFFDRGDRARLTVTAGF
jgi:hypothetical protein